MSDFNTHLTSIDHISFDLWLTLVRSHPDFKKRRAELLKTYFEIKQPLEQVQKVLRYYDVTCNRINELAGGNLDTSEIILLILSGLEADLNRIDGEHLNEFYEEMEALIVELPPMLLHQDIPEMLSVLKASGFSLNLLSNTGFIKGKTLDKVLRQLGILENFSFQIYSDEIGVSKPNKKAFEAVFEKAVLIRDIQKENILHIGDNAIADVLGAQDYGFKSALISPDFYTIREIIKL